MNATVMSSICFGSILAGTLLGVLLNRRLPKHHVDGDSRDTIKLAWGTIATMAALALSLLLASAKSSYETANAQNTLAATNIIVLNNILVKYGPDAKAARADLRNDVATGIKKIWPETASTDSALAILESGNGMEQIQDELSRLVPPDEMHRALLSKAQQLAGDITQTRWMIVEQSRTGLPATLFVILLVWLTMLFIGLGLLAPRNKTVFVSLLMCNVAFSTAIFLISEMSHPLQGTMKISSAPMVKALEHLSQP